MRKKRKNKLCTEDNIAFIRENYHKGQKFCAASLNITARQVAWMAYYLKIKRHEYFEANYNHYLYRHIRLDKNEPFYVGIGTINPYKTFATAHKRAYEKHSHNPIWNKIVSKTDYIVQIIFTHDDYDVIKRKEIEFIKLYGRKDCKTGGLANLTDGGDGVLGCRMGKSVYVYNLKTKTYIGRFNSHTEASKFLNISTTTINQGCLGKTLSNKKFFFSNYEIDINNLPKPYQYKGDIGVFDADQNLIYQSDLIGRVCQFLKINSRHLHKALRQGTLLKKEFTAKYLNLK